MGMLGGIQVLRAHIHKENFQDPSLHNSRLHTIFPRICHSSKCCHRAGDSDGATAVLENDQRQTIWRRRVDFNAGFYSVLLCALAITDNRLRMLNDQTKFIASFDTVHEATRIICQLVVAHSQLTIIIGLCMDSGKSVTSKLLRKGVFQFLGRISLSLYLLHVPYIHFTKFCMIRLLFNSDPFWLPFIGAITVITTSPIVAFAITKYFEEPLTKMLKNSNKQIMS